MGEILKIAIPAIIALVGTVLTVLLGYRQWKRQQNAARDASFLSQSQQIYNELWQKLEDVHIRLRTYSVNNDAFDSLVRDVNSYILKQSLYLEANDQKLANQYLLGVRKFTELVSRCKSEDARRDAALTVILSPSVEIAGRELAEVQAEVYQTREKILARFRKVLRGHVGKI